MSASLESPFLADPRTDKVTADTLLSWDVTQVHHVYAFGIVPFRVVASPTHSNEFMIEYLLVHGKANNKWSFPKGKIDPKEPSNGFFTARREFSEETGINILSNDKLIHFYDWYHPWIFEYNYCRDYGFNGGKSDVNYQLFDNLNKRSIVHKYICLFLAQLKNDLVPSNHRPYEICHLQWMTFKDAASSIPRFDASRDILVRIHGMLLNQLQRHLQRLQRLQRNINNLSLCPILKINCEAEKRYFNTSKPYHVLIKKLQRRLARMEAENAQAMDETEKLECKQTDACETVSKQFESDAKEGIECDKHVKCRSTSAMTQDHSKSAMARKRGESYGKHGKKQQPRSRNNKSLGAKSKAQPKCRWRKVAK